MTFLIDQFENAGTLKCINGGALTIQSALSNSGRIHASDGGMLSLNGSWTNRGTITNQANVNLGGTSR